MDTIAHSAHAFWIYYLLHYLFWHIIPSPTMGLLVMIAGNLPDFDGVYSAIKGKDPNSNEFQHHLYYWSHWPITYTPLIILFIISVIFNWYPQYCLVPMVGIYMHLISDTACCGDGMMWGKNPWKKNEFAPFYNFFSSKTDGYHGSYWTVRWRQTGMFKIAQIEALGIIAYYLLNQYQHGFNFSSTIIIFALFLSMVFSFVTIKPKYKEEPPKGRYADYRKHPAYLKWMDEHQYTFNTKMHVIKQNHA